VRAIGLQVRGAKRNTPLLWLESDGDRAGVAGGDEAVANDVGSARPAAEDTSEGVATPDQSGRFLHEVRMFGRFTISGQLGPELVRSWSDRHSGGRAVYLLFARLLVAEGGWLRRDELLDAIWRDAEAGSARSSFFAALQELKRRLQSQWPNEAWIESDHGMYRLRCEKRLNVDLWALHSVLRLDSSDESQPPVARLNRLSACLARFLLDAPVDLWADTLRERYSHLIEATMVREVARYREANDWETARMILLGALTWLPESEPLYAALRTVEGPADRADSSSATDHGGAWRHRNAAGSA
jgi:two-component SAPR family response regulator